MIVSKTKVPNSSLKYIYNKEYDVLDIFIEEISPAFADENYYGVYTYYDRKTDEIIGASIMNYKKRNKEFIKKYLPFNVDFNYIDRNIVN
jgi:hypothetical protein